MFERAASAALFFVLEREPFVENNIKTVAILQHFLGVILLFSVTFIGQQELASYIGVSH
jgi:hypothetical protein